MTAAGIATAGGFAALPPGLATRLATFSFMPADYLHPSRRASFGGAVPEAVWADARARRSLSALVLQGLGLAQRPCLDAACAELPLALLDAARLETLSRGIAALRLAPLVRRSLLREQVLHWKRRLTPRLHEFALHSAVLLPGLPALEAEPDGPIEPLGHAWICAGLANAPDEIRLRAVLKLPADTLPAPVDPAHARRVVGTVLSALDPQWCTSFATPR